MKKLLKYKDFILEAEDIKSSVTKEDEEIKKLNDETKSMELEIAKKKKELTLRKMKEIQEAEKAKKQLNL